MSDLLPLLWLDLETTGLSFESDQIIEVAACVTEPTAPYRRLDAGHYQSLVRPVPPFVVGDFVLTMHTTNGLWHELATHPSPPSLAQVESELLSYIGRTVAGSKLTLAGSGVGPFDKRMIDLHMPRLAKRLTYYVFDVGVVGRFRESLGFERRESDGAHRAWSDVEHELSLAVEYAEASSQQRVRLVCATCLHPIGIGDPMRLLRAEPTPRFGHIECSPTTNTETNP